MEKHTFVARRQELEHLNHFLNQSLNSKGTVCFVTGEAGTGKTSLVNEFAREAQERHDLLVVAFGQSDSQTGVSDAYLPFREVLGQLTGDVETKITQGSITPENADRLRKLLALSGQAILEVGPDLIGLFVPAGQLATRFGAFVVEKAGWLDKLEQLAGRSQTREGDWSTGIEQSHIYEQYTNVLKKISEKRPLLLVLDDLHWADVASVGLLFRLGRRIGSSRIMIVGTYRPEEVAIGRSGERHPMEKVLAEFKRYYGDIFVDLDRAEREESRYFVDAFLDTEPNKLGEGFRQLLVNHTGGHPLFTVELLRDMQERGDLVQDEVGKWMESPLLDWAELASRVEGVIEERIDRLENELRQALTIGSVEGEQFTAEVVARVQDTDARRLIQHLSGELQKQHRLISAQSVRRLDPSGQRLSLYRFQHNLFQKYLYNELDEVERVCLHEDVGTMMEKLYGDQVEDVAIQLARHFVEAGLSEKAVIYLQLAGNQAAMRYANEEAVAYFSQALSLLQQDDPVRRYDLLVARAKVRSFQGDYKAQREDLSLLLEVAEALGEKERQTDVALHYMIYLYNTGNYLGTMEISERVLDLAKAAGDEEIEANINLWSGMAIWRQGQYKLAFPKIERALDLAVKNQLHQLEANSLRQLGIIYGNLGDLARSVSLTEQALAKYREIGDRGGEASALNNLGVQISILMGDLHRSRGYFEKFLQISREIGDRNSEALAVDNLGMVEFWLSDFDRAIKLLSESSDIHREVGNIGYVGRAYKELGYCYLALGEFKQAKAYYDQALELISKVSNLKEEIDTLIQYIEYYSTLGDYERSGSCYEEVISRCGDIDDRDTEIWKLIAFSLCKYFTGDYKSAEEHIRRVLHIVGDQRYYLRGKGLTILGYSLTVLGELAEAEDVYRQVVSLSYETHRPRQAIEALSGLARVSMARGDTEQALSQVEDILIYLENETPSLGHPLDGTIEPVRTYLTCYQVLKANKDNRAHDILANAYNFLKKRAANISDEELRYSFLHNVAANREVESEFENIYKSGLLKT